LIFFVLILCSARALKNRVDIFAINMSLLCSFKKQG
jgi:hypothetical protein